MSPWDPGLQPERTALAWQRTLLSGMACALVTARLLVEVTPTGAALTAGLALLGTATLAWVEVQRYRRNDAAVRSGRRLADARSIALLTGLVAVTAVAAALFVALA